MKHLVFISYKHSVRGRQVAIAIEDAIKKYAKPIWKWPPNIFRDENYLVPDPDLPQRIEKALESSKFYILIADPESARSEWCNKEIKYWIEKDPNLDYLIIVKSYGIISDNGKNTDWTKTNALPQILSNKLNSIPFYVDVSNHESNESLSLENTNFKSIINTISAKLRGVDPYILNDENIKIVKKNRFIRNVLILSILILLSSLIFAVNILGNNQKRALKNEILFLDSLTTIDKLRIDALNVAKTNDSLRIKELTEKQKALVELNIQQELRKQTEIQLEGEKIIAKLNQDQVKIEDRRKRAFFIAGQAIDENISTTEAYEKASLSNDLYEGNGMALNSLLNTYYNRNNYILVDTAGRPNINNTTIYFNDTLGVINIKSSNTEINFDLNSIIPEYNKIIQSSYSYMVTGTQFKKSFNNQYYYNNLFSEDGYTLLIDVNTLNLTILQSLTLHKGIREFAELYNCEYSGAPSFRSTAFEDSLYIKLYNDCVNYDYLNKIEKHISSFENVQYYPLEHFVNDDTEDKLDFLTIVDSKKG